MTQVVLVTGSRAASPAIVAKAVEVERWCQADGHRVVVGDAPGVDAAVRLACAELGVPVRVYGAYGKVRQAGLNPDGEVALEGDYRARDRYMARQCSLCVAVWDGVSRGTRDTATYAQRLGTRVLWRVFPRGAVA
jgi:hypothetical protein